MSSSLAQRLRIETRALHTAAERSDFMGVLLRGKMPRAAYCALLHNLHTIYRTLEPALAHHAAHPSIAPVFAPVLLRTLALERDLRVLHGDPPPFAAVLQPATLTYAARRREIDAARPELLLAHAYVRFLGDLSGGQMLRRIVAQGTSFDGSGAVAFYDFGDAGEVDAASQAFRVGLASIDLPQPREDALVDEARWAFEQHRRLFDELAVAYGLT